MLFLIVLMFMVEEGTCHATSQTPSYEHQDPATGQMLTCSYCAAGYHMFAHCTATTPTECAKCPEKHYTEHWNYLSKCLYCNTFCLENQFVKEECSETTNRVCECKEGYYWHAETCTRHTECPAGYGVKRIGTTQRNTECEKCSDGSFCSIPSSHAKCENHSICESHGRQTIIRGTSWHDNMCATCGHLKDEDVLKTLRTFLPDFLSYHKMRLSKMRTLIWRYLPPSMEHQGEKPSQSVQSGQKGALLGLIRQWVKQAPEEDLRSFPEMLRKSQLHRVAERLERRLKEINQAALC